MSSVHKRTRRGRTTYRAVWREPGTNGTSVQRNRTFQRAADAKAFAARMAEEHERQGFGDPLKHTVGKYLRSWLATLRQEARKSPNTLVSYTSSVKHLCRHLESIPLADLTPGHLDHCYAMLLKAGGKPGPDGVPRPLKPTTVRLCHALISKALNDARRRWKMVAINVAADATAPRPPRHQKPRCFSREEVARLLKAAHTESEEMGGLAATALIVGARRGELCGLAFDQLDLQAGTLTIARTVILDHGVPVLVERAKNAHSLRTVAIPPELTAFFRAEQRRAQEAVVLWGAEHYTRRGGPLMVFPDLAGRPQHPDRMSRRLRRLMRAAGIMHRQPTHAWRHTSATLMLDDGTPLKVVQQRLGHASATTTIDVYGHALDERDRQASERLGRLIG